MALTRDNVPSRVSCLLDGRAVRWVPADRLVGDYDGRERTLEVFDAPASEQRSLLRRLRPLRREIERVIGGAFIVIFHTPGETARLYPEVRRLRRGYGLPTALLTWLLEGVPRDVGAPSPVEVSPDPGVADPPYEEAA
ncbi:MAG: hypothetical protein V2A73_10330 [Pseudomonadota bacterium]